MMKKLSIKILAHGSFYLLTTFSRLKQFNQIRLKKNHNKYVVYKKEELHPGDIAIIAVYAEAFKTDSTLRLISFLEKAKINLVVVINKNKETENFLKVLASCKATVLVRPNIGRDFGAYQTGTKYLQSLNLKNQTDRFIYANDSIIYPPKFESTLQEYLSKNSPWSTLFLNLEHHVHAQSFFFSLSCEVFYSHSVMNFWAQYYPSNFRRHAIDKGEVLLSQALIQAGYSPDTFVNAFLVRELMQRKGMTIEEELKILEQSRFESYFVESKLKNRASVKRGIETFEMQYLATKAQEILVTKNPAHVLGAYLTRVKHLPLKLDAIRHSVISPSGLIASLVESGTEYDETILILNALMAKGSRSSHRSLGKLWDRFGLI